MRKANIVLLILGVILALAIGAFIVLNAFSSSFINPFTSNYSNQLNLISDQTMPLDDIDTLNLDFGSAEVIVEPSKETALRVIQYSNINQDKANEQFWPKLNKSKNKLSISSGKKNVGFNFGFSINYRERIEIYVPEDFHGHFNSELGSGSIECSNFLFDSAFFDIGSGLMSLNSLEIENNIGFDISSGDVNCSNLSAKNMDLEVGSGFLKGENIQAESFKGIVSSGSVNLSGRFEQIDNALSSGNFILKSDVLPNQIFAKASSGNCSIFIPENDGFSFKYNKSSGEINSDFELFSYQELNSSYDDKSGSFQYKDGGPVIDVDISSGSFSLNKIS